MKVFEVTMEFCRSDSKEIEREVNYVTSELDTLISVVEYFTEHCFQYDKDLIGVREVLNLVTHIPVNSPDD